MQQNTRLMLDHNVSLLSHLRKAAQNTKAGITFIQSADEEVRLSYAELYELSQYCLHNLSARGVRKGDQLIIQTDNNRLFLIVFWACLLGGIIPIPLSSGDREEHRQKLSKILKGLPRPCLATSRNEIEQLARVAENLDLNQEASSRFFIIDDLIEKVSKASAEPIQSDDLAYIQYSSGSTGDPKGVSLTHRNLIVNASDIVERCETTSSDVSLSWMPLSHDMGLICFHLGGLIAGLEQLLMPTQLFVRRPVLWLEKANQHRVTQLYSPNFGYHYFLSAFDASSAPTWDLSSIRYIINGAEPISWKLCRRFIDTLMPFGLGEDTIYPGYGLAEASVAVALPDPGDKIKVHKLSRNTLQIGQSVEATDDEGLVVSFVETGYPVQNCEVRILDEVGNEVEDKVIGKIMIRGGNVTSGYYLNPEATSKLIKEDGWVETGDLGFFIEGRLVITGRAKNMIIVNGQNYYPQDIERVVETEFPDLQGGKVVACAGRNELDGREELLVFFQHRGKPNTCVELVKGIRQVILERIGLGVEAVIPVRQIPRTTSGKVQHFKLANRYNDGEFNDLLSELQQEGDFHFPSAPMEQQALLETIWKEVSELSLGSSSDSFLPAGATSLTITRFLNRIVERTGLKLDFQDIIRASSFNDLSRVITKDKFDRLPEIKSSSIQEYYPLSPGQQRFWALNEIDNSGIALNLCNVSSIGGAFEINCLQKAVDAIVNRYEILRTSFHFIDDEPVQKVHSVSDLCFEVKYEDLTANPNGSETAETIVNEIINRPFDLTTGPLFRIHVIKTSEKQFTQVFVMHHLISDGWSVGLLVEELGKLYKAFLKNEEVSLSQPKIQYRDYVLWQEEILETNRLLSQKRYWEQILDGAEPEIDWPLEGREQHGDFEGEEIGFSLDKSLTTDISDICSRYAVTPFTVLYVGLQVLIARYTRKKDLLIGTSAAGRTHHSIENQLGYFISTLPLRMKVSGNESFELLLQRAHQVLVDALSNQEFPVDLLDHSLAAKATDFEVLLLYQNLERPFHFENAWEDLEVKTLDLRNTSSLANMEWEFQDSEEGLFCRLRYKKRRFEYKFMAQISRHFVQILQTLIQNPNEQVSCIKYLNKKEEDLLIKFRTGPQVPKAVIPVIQQFERQAKAAPNSCAITFNNASFSYGEIDKKTSKIANYLSDTCGLNHGARVGVFISRSVEMIVALLAIHKIGAAYVPLDTEWPVERLRFVLEDSNVDLVLTKEDLLSSLSEISKEIIAVESILSSSASELWNTSPESISGEAAAYIMYTSGTTGTPKGVVVSQDNLADYVNAFSSWFKLSSRDVVIQQSSIAFDVSVEEIFPVLVEGGELVVVEDGGRNIDALVQQVKRHHATIISTTPLVINELNNTHAWSEMTDLRILISGGDVLEPGYVSKVPDRINIYNTYGPTETTVCVTYQKIEKPEDCLLVGSPIPNHVVYLLDENLQEVPPGVAGEICVAGKGLARGYINRPEETAEKFISLSPLNNDRVYRSGDLGVWTDDGNIIFKGRKDDQLKWRGYRIEPAEIAHRIMSIEGVTNALVIIKEFNKERFLVAYFVAEHGFQSVNLRKYLEEYFPPYLVPTHFVQLSNFPLNSNGKPDKKLLPLPDDLSTENKTLVKPKSATEKTVLDIWQDVLNKKHISTTDNFFQIGGHSLKAAKIASRIKEKFRVDFSLREVFRFLTVDDIANYIDQIETKELAKVAVVGARDHYPLSSAQRRLWILDNFKNNKIANNLSWSFRIDRENLALLKKAIGFIISRHTSLRTTFNVVEEQPVQVIHPSDKLKVEIPVVLTSETESNESKYQLARHTFELDQWPLFRFVALDTGGNDYEIVSTFHHIITDGYSMENLLEELDICLESLANEEEIILPKLDIQYHDFAVWENKWLNSQGSIQQRDFWLSQLSGTLPVLQLPQLNTRPAVSKNRGKVFRQTLPGELIEQLQLIAKEEGVSFFTLLCSILKLLLHRYSGQSDFIIGTAAAKRNLRELEPQIGYYLNILPLRTSFIPSDSFLGLLKQVSVTTSEALQNEDYPIDKLIEDLSLQKGTGRSALFDVIFILQNFDHDGLNELKSRSGYFDDFQEIDNGTSLVDLHVEINCIQDHWTLKVRYNTEVFEEKQIVNFSEHYINLANAVILDRERPLFAYNFMTEVEEQLLEQYSAGPQIQVDSATINELFARTVDEHSDKIAVRFGKDAFTYESLDNAVHRVANCLLASNLSSGDVVGILMNRSEKTVAAILGVLRAGATYLPLDPEYPLSRLEYMLEDSGAKYFIVEDQRKVSAFESRPIKAKMLKWLDISDFPSAKSYDIDTVRPYDPAYIMYTSGSTGRPKGVKVLHASLADYCQTFNNYFRVDASDIVVQQSSLSFDVSIEEIFPILCVGGTLVIAEKGGRDIAALLRIIQEDKATILSTTPGVIRELNRAEYMPRLESLRILISGGDKLDKSYIDKLIPGISIYNTYGPTEVTVCASYHKVRELENTGLIGRPTPNHSIYLLDTHNQKVPLGIKGEICVSGPGIAQGYLNEPELTNGKFVQLPDSQDEMVFKTGDVGLWREDGTLQFVGRNDDQLKINGYRVETNEVANTLKRYAGVNEAIVIPRESNGKHVLIAYLQGEEGIELSELRMWMFGQLPFYMVPAYLTFVDSFKRTTNGKIDLKAMPEVSLQTESNGDLRLPSTNIQKVIAGMWAEVLNTTEVGLDDNFFRLGGNSIKATQIISRVNKKYQIDLGLEELFVATSLDHFVKSIIEHAGEQKAEIKLLEQQTDYPLSYAQQRMWILNELEENKSAYNVFWAYKLEGELNVKRLESSIHKLADRHGILRTSFEARNGVPRQVVSKNSHPEIFHFIDLTLVGINSKDGLETILQSERNREFDLQRAPLARFLLIRTGENEHVLSINAHHILTDGWSMAVLAKDLGFLYQGGSDSAGSLPNLDHSYADFSAFHNLLLQDGTKRAAKEYWMDQFSEEAPLLHLATDYPRPSMRKGKGGISRIQISEALVQQLEELSRFMSTSTFVVLLANLKVLLSRYTGQTDIVIGTPVSGRTFADQDHQAGLYVNTLPIRLKFSQANSFTDILANVKKVVLEGLQYQDYPFDKLVDDLKVERDLSRNPLFDVMLAMQQSPVAYVADGLSPELKVESFPVDSCTSKFDLNLNVFEENRGLELVLEYDSSLFHQQTAERFLTHYINLLTKVLESPDAQVYSVDYLSEEEKNSLLKDFGKGESIHIDFKSPLQLIGNYGDSPAVIVEDRVVSYQALLREVDQVARTLVFKHGIKQNDRIGVLLDRNEHMLATLLAIFKSGATYVPIDPKYPQARIEYLLNDSNISSVITQEEYIEFLDHRVNPVMLQELYEEHTNNDPFPEVQIQPNQIAYVIYTSGSTGNPKGVAITYANLSSFLQWARSEFDSSMFDIVYAVSSYCFDLSIFELFFPLTVGKPVRILATGLSIPDYLAVDRKVLLNTVPSVVNYLIGRNTDLSNVSILNMAGEAVQVKLKEYFSDKEIKVNNLYGPSEYTTYTTMFIFSDEVEGVPIGKPIANTQLYILDSNRGLQAKGCVGELAISGAGIAAGYINRPDATKNSFVDNPFMPGDTMYMTGDLGKWTNGGNIEFLGRKDHQVKVRGYRIEPGEIEQAIKSIEGVDHAIVINQISSNDEPLLVAYYTSKAAVTEGTVSGILKGNLPSYMIPSAIIPLESFPLTPNGKIDRKQLPSADEHFNDLSEVLVNPRNEIELKLFNIWNKILGNKEFGVTQNFFRIGGHSLHAAQITHHIQNEFDVAMELKEIFLDPTIEGLAARIGQSAKSVKRQIPLVKASESYELSAAQHRLWILHQLEESNAAHAYHVSGTYVLKGRPDIELLQQSYAILIQRHEILRTVFRLEDGVPKQVMLPFSKFDEPIEIETVSKASDIDGALTSKILDDQKKPFDLEKGPLFRLKLFKVSEEEFHLSITLHHIICDGWSLAIMMQEITSIYEALTHSREPKLKELPIQYKDFAAWSNMELHSAASKNDKEYWKQQLRGELPILDLPTDYPRPSRKTYHGNEVIFQLEPSRKSEIKEVSSLLQVSPFVLFSSLFSFLLHRYTGQAQTIIGTAMNGRLHPDLAGLSGFFVNTVPLRIQHEGGSKLEDHIKLVNNIIHDAWQHQSYPFDLLVDELDLHRDLSRSPVFDVMVLNQSDLPGDRSTDVMSDFDVHEKLLNHKTSKFDLTVTFVTGEDADWQIRIEYNSDIYLESRIKRMAAHLDNLLNNLSSNLGVVVESINFVPEEEQGYLKEVLGKGDEVMIPEKTIVELFEEQVKKNPGLIAVKFEEKEITYQELSDQANHISSVLLEKYQLQSGDRVGIMTERSLNTPAGILGVLKAGCVYVPIDQNYPDKRKEFIIRDSDAKLLLTDQDISWEKDMNRVFRIDTLERPTQTVSHGAISSCDSAYVIYTSGTSGQPKGVEVTHSSVVNLCAWIQELIYRNHDRPLVSMLTASIAFDSSVKQLFPPLLSGSTLVLVSDEKRKDPAQLEMELMRHSVDVIDMTPAYLGLFLDHLNDRSIPLNYLLAGGETLGSDLVHRFYQRTGENSKLINVYGVTEATVDSSFHIAKPEDRSPVPIGKPVFNTELFIFDNNISLTARGYVGEICIAGKGISKGYVNNQKLTNARFVQHPFKPDEKIYRTGDNGRWDENGNLIFLGRNDRQVKVRGYRVELQEIEHHFSSYTPIKDCVVTDRNEELVGYIVPHENQEVDSIELKNHLKKFLPDYMIPSRITSVDQIPLNVNGKVDLDSLEKKVKPISTNRDFVQPDTKEEKELVEIWKEELQVENVGAEDNFFELGGHSLKAILVISRVRKSMNVSLTPTDLFRYPTIRELAIKISQESANRDAHSENEADIIFEETII